MKTKRGVLSLKDISLECISRNFPRFNAAYCPSEDTDLQGNLQFLRRFHASYFITRHSHGEYLDECYWNFLINEYLKELDVGIFIRGNWELLLKRISEVGSGFEAAYFYFHECLDFQKMAVFVNKAVCCIPNVKRLDLIGCAEDKTLEIVSSCCPELKELLMDGGRVTSDGLKSLCQESERRLSLKVLNLVQVGDIEDGISFLLQNMPSLVDVGYIDLPSVLHNMHKHDTNSSLQRKYNLTYLDLDCYFSGIDFEDMLAFLVNVCPHINRLSVLVAKRRYLELVSGFTEIEQLHVKADDFDHTPNRDIDISDLLEAKGGILRKLYVEKLHLSALALVKSCPKIETLRLIGVVFEAPGFHHRGGLRPLNNLRKLFLKDLDFHDDITQQSLNMILESSERLEELKFCGCTFQNSLESISGLVRRCESSELKHLQFLKCEIGDALMRSILSTCSANGNFVNYYDHTTPIQLGDFHLTSNTSKRYLDIYFD